VCLTCEQVDKTFPLEETARALDELQAGGHVGKVVIAI
jgi:NADPH:quinone reductase-like Zn-dependent oxidoreductase